MSKLEVASPFKQNGKNDLDSSIEEGDDLISHFVAHPIPLDQAPSFYNKKLTLKKEEEGEDNDEEDK